MSSTADRIQRVISRYERPLIVDFATLGPTTLAKRIAEAAKVTHRTPSDPQKRAGNFRMGHFWWNGREISIENPRGSIRSGTSRSGKKWSVKMAGHYGYIRRTLSKADGDHVDVFVGPHPQSDLVCVIDQHNPEGDFDEHKAVICCNSVKEGKQLYLDCYSAGWTGFKSITPMTRHQFFAWLDKGDTSKPIAGQVSQYAKDVSEEKRDERGQFSAGHQSAKIMKESWDKASNGGTGAEHDPFEISRHRNQVKSMLPTIPEHAKEPANEHLGHVETLMKHVRFSGNHKRAFPDTPFATKLDERHDTLANQADESHGRLVEALDPRYGGVDMARWGGYSRLQVAIERYQQFDESKVKRDEGGKFAVQSGHTVPSGSHVDVAGDKFAPGSWIHSHQISALTPEQRQAHVASLAGRKLGERQYRDENWKPLSAKDEAELKELKIRPDLKDVVVMRNEHSELKGYGTDSKGRRQPFYPSAHHERAKAAKFERLKEFQSQIKGVLDRIRNDLSSTNEKTRESALLAHLIEKTGMRIGSDKDTGAEKKATGATTLEPQHVKVDGDHVTMDFTGKSGHENHWEVTDPVIAAEFKKRLASGKGRLFSVDAPAFRKYMHDVAPGFKPAKDFRTAKAAEHAMKSVEELPLPESAAEYRESLGKIATSVSGEINNTPDVAFSSYIPPEVFGSWQAHLLSKGIDTTGLKPSYPKEMSTAERTKLAAAKVQTGGSPIPKKKPQPKASQTPKTPKTTEVYSRWDLVAARFAVVAPIRNP